MDVFGVGVLIRGMSGVGKSEIALELVSRGHRLACDDAVIIKQTSDGIIGYAPASVRHFSEVRGIGLIDVVSLYGAEAVKLEQRVELIVQLEAWDENKEYERVGKETEKENLIGTDVVKMTIPVTPGRNVAVIVETAASVYRQRMMGFIAARELEKRLGKK
jgi:HPr kinase/phosphorylase